MDFFQTLLCQTGIKTIKKMSYNNRTISSIFLKICGTCSQLVTTYMFRIIITTTMRNTCIKYIHNIPNIKFLNFKQISIFFTWKSRTFNAWLKLSCGVILHLNYSQCSFVVPSNLSINRATLHLYPHIHIRWPWHLWSSVKESQNTMSNQAFTCMDNDTRAIIYN